MDKETLSNYGWIVICVLVLAVMIALASPFGNFVSDAVKSTTAGLFGVNQEALGAAGIVIDDQSFADTNGGTGGDHGGTGGGNAGGGYVDAEYTGGVEDKDLGTITWEQLIADSADGSYATKYKVGNTLTLVKADGTTGVKYRIVGINHDTIANSTDKAHLTLVNENVLTTHAMNSNNSNANGWASSEMKTYLQGDFMNEYIPATALDSIKTVTKTSYDKTTNAVQTTEDKVWIPSFTEVGFNAAQNSTVFNAEGGSAYAYFTSDASRTKTGANTGWWLRSARSNSSNGFYYVNNNGTCNTNIASNTYGVVLGFCI